MSDSHSSENPLIWFFDQVSMKLGTDHPGYCAGMVVCWIMLRNRGEDFDLVSNKWGDYSASPSEEQLRLISAYQSQHVSQPGRVGYSKIFSANVENAFNVNASGGSYDGVCLSDIADFVSQKTTNDHSVIIDGRPTSFFIVRFRSTGHGSGHVIAIEVKGTNTGPQTFRLMDAGQGCYELPSLSRFKTWLTDDYLKSSGYLELYTKRIKVHHIIFPKPDSSNVPGLIFQSFLDFFKRK